MNTNKTQTSADVKPRRLGRGLSALIGQPVKIDVPPPSADRSGGAASPSVSVGGGAMGGVAGGAARAASASVTPRASSGDEANALPPAVAAGAPADGGVTMLAVESIVPGRFQPRRVFDESQLKELAASIASAGVVQPIVVRPAGVGGVGGPKYELIAGERRWRACQLAGLKRVPAIVREVSDEVAAEWSLIENLQRSDLTAMERAEAVQTLCVKFGLSHQQAAEKLGIDRSSVANMVRLLELEPPIRRMLDEGKLLNGHGKALLSAPGGQSRVNLATIAANQGWSVRKLEQAAQNAAMPSGAGAAVPVEANEKAVNRAAALRDLEKQLGEHLGTAVAIRTSSSGKRGSVVLKFYDLDHFDGLMSKMGFRLR